MAALHSAITNAAGREVRHSVACGAFAGIGSCGARRLRAPSRAPIRRFRRFGPCAPMRRPLPQSRRLPGGLFARGAMRPGASRLRVFVRPSSAPRCLWARHVRRAPPGRKPVRRRLRPDASGAAPPGLAALRDPGGWPAQAPAQAARRLRPAAGAAAPRAVDGSPVPPLRPSRMDGRGRKGRCRRSGGCGP